MSEVPKGGSVWGDPDCTATWVRVKNVGDMVQVSNFEGYVQYFNPKSHIFPPVGYVRIDKPSILRTDTAGRDVTDLPGLWSEDDTITDLSQPFTVEWLCEIGGELGHPQQNVSVVGFWSQHAHEWILRYSTIDGWSLNGEKMSYFAPPSTTRGDVLKWLDVLGVEVKKGGGES